MPPSQRKECTRSMRLTACGDVDATETSKIWKTLPGPLHDTAVQSILGRSGLTSHELASVPHCSGAAFIYNIQKLTDNNECPFCMKGPESRYHWRHECTQSRPGFLHKYTVISHVLAACGPTLWFDTSRRLCASSGIPQHDSAWWANHNVEMGEPGCQQWELAGTNYQENTPTITGDRCRSLRHHWKGRLHESFSQDAHRVLREALSPEGSNNTGLEMVADCQLELKAWIRDVFDIQGERMTSALTVSCLFNANPGVLGQEWGERSTWKLDYDTSQPRIRLKNTPPG